MADSNEVDAALVAKLGDATLAATLTDGVWWDIAPQGKTKFVIVSQMAHEDEYMFGGSAFERFVYLVKAVVSDTTTTAVKTGAARIHTLLHGGALTITGYELRLMQRIERVRMTEVEQGNDDVRWQHRGGLYEVLVEPTV